MPGFRLIISFSPFRGLWIALPSIDCTSKWPLKGLGIGLLCDSDPGVNAWATEKFRKFPLHFKSTLTWRLRA